MPSVSRAQHGYAGMSRSPSGRKTLIAQGRKPMPVKVASEFLKADKGKVKALPKRQPAPMRTIASGSY